MQSRRLFQTIDTHTCGQPTRTIYGGVGPIPGDSISAKMLYFKEHHDDIRKLLMFEPRGNDIMSGVILTEPCDPRCDIGVIFIEVGGYLPMCGHDTIGVATALVEMGMPKPSEEPCTTLNLDTPAGLVRVKVKVEGGKAMEVSLVNVPAFVLEQDIVVEIPSIGKIRMDISYGGNFYAVIKASDVGLRIVPEEAGRAVRLGRQIREAVNGAVDVRHPEHDFIRGLTHVQFYEKMGDSPLHYRNTVVIPDGTLDRSPCGTGSSARMASLYARGELKAGGEFIHESIIGSKFRCRVMGECTVGNRTAVLPEITGSAYVTGLHTFFLDPSDPFAGGFQLSCF